MISLQASNAVCGRISRISRNQADASKPDKVISEPSLGSSPDGLHNLHYDKAYKLTNSRNDCTDEIE